MSYKKLTNELEGFLNSHPEIGTVGKGFEDQREDFITKTKEWVIAWISEPKGGGFITSRFLRIELILSDKLLDGRENEVDVISDLHLIMEDVKEWFANLGNEDFELSNFNYNFTAGNTTGEEAVDVRAFFDFDFVNLGTCEL